MRVLITGGYGFIGAWIIRNLLSRGDEVWVFDLREDARRLRLILPESEVAKVTFVQGDVCDLKALSAAITYPGVTCFHFDDFPAIVCLLMFALTFVAALLYVS